MTRPPNVTPKLLRAIFRLFNNHVTSRWQSVDAHAADLLIAALFFAMRGCEYLKTPRPGRTKRITLGDLVFRDIDRRLIDHQHPELELLAITVTVTFRNQKNGKKMDTRTQYRSGDSVLCPVLRWASVVRRVLASVPDASPATYVNTVRTLTGKIGHLSSSFTLTVIRQVCAQTGGFATYGFHPHELGNPSIRSGAAMALFLMNHSTAKIMILGRWSSDAFLVYIRPQVMEWSRSLSADMIRFDHFFDANDPPSSSVPQSDPRTRRHPAPSNGPGSQFSMPSFYLHD